MVIDVISRHWRRFLCIHAAPQLLLDPPTPLGGKALGSPAAKEGGHDGDAWVCGRFIWLLDPEFFQRWEAHHLLPHLDRFVRVVVVAGLAAEFKIPV